MNRRGKAGMPSALFLNILTEPAASVAGYGDVMKPIDNMPLTRRVMLRTLAGCVAVLAGCGLIGPIPGGGFVEAFKRSGRGRRISNAAKKHNANHLYATFEAAQADVPHPGDRSQVVQITLSRARFDELFGAGNLSVDLRQL